MVMGNPLRSQQGHLLGEQIWGTNGSRTEVSKIARHEQHELLMMYKYVYNYIYIHIYIYIFVLIMGDVYSINTVGHSPGMIFDGTAEELNEFTTKTTLNSVVLVYHRETIVK